MEQKNNYFGIIYRDAIQGKSIRQVHKDLYNTTINQKEVDPFLLQFAMKLSKKAVKLNKGQEPNLIVLALIDLFFKKKADSNAKKLINKRVVDESSDKKDILLRDYLIDSRAEGRIFYLASSHKDSASDHAPYQGKIYIDDQWETIISDEKIQKKIRKYINRHKIKTYQWVIKDPVWFVTRPYCRHYFISLTVHEVLHNSVKKLKEKHNSEREVGDREMQTPPKAAIAEYEERLAILKRLYREFPDEKIKAMIDKIELLIKKWKKLL